jgi:hypothetical protein
MQCTMISNYTTIVNSFLSVCTGDLLHSFLYFLTISLPVEISNQILGKRDCRTGIR